MKELKEGVDYYVNDEGLVVLTEKFHLERGYCCGCGCLHCPFHYENVPEPRKSEIEARKSKMINPEINKIESH